MVRTIVVDKNNILVNSIFREWHKHFIAVYGIRRERIDLHVEKKFVHRLYNGMTQSCLRYVNFAL